MPKVTKIINGEYIGGEKYTITDAGEGKSIISFTPDTVLKEGTPIGAEILNEMQKNSVYSLIGTRNISGQKEIYTCNVDGINDFGLFDIVLIMTPNLTNTTQNIYLDLSGNEFQIVSNNIILVGDLQANEPYIFKLTSVTKKAFLIGSDKLKKGTYLGKASDLDNDKYDKTGGILSGAVTINTEINSNKSHISFRNNNVERGFIGNVETTDSKSFHIKNTIAGDGIILYDNGTAYFKMNNLTTPTREVGAAINYLNTENTTNKGNITNLQNNLNNLTTTVNNIKGRWKTFTGSSTSGTFVDDGWLFGFVTVRFKDERGVNTTVPVTNTSENFMVFEQVDSTGNIYHDLINIFGTNKIWTYSAIKQKGISIDLFASKCVLFYPV